MEGKKIPISKAKEISRKYNYEHVIIIAWNGFENESWWTTYGKNKTKCAFTKEIAKDLKKHF